MPRLATRKSKQEFVEKKDSPRTRSPIVQPEELPDDHWLERVTVGQAELCYIGDEGHFEHISYRIISVAALPESLPYGSGLIEGNLFISENVPLGWRDPILTHEIECLHIKKHLVGHCLMALKKELRLIPPDEFDQYVLFRLEFFRAFVRYNLEQGDQRGIQKEIEASLEFLETLQRADSVA